jgi:hypothetical protein
MQLLITTGTVNGTQPIYLPYDKAPVPFGDPLAATWTAATPTVVTVPGYLPTNGDAVALSIAGTSGFLSSLSGLTTISAQLNTTYYVSSASGDTFTLSTQKASAATPAGVLSMITTGMQLGGQDFVHLLSNQVDGTTLPFKPTNTVLAMNGGTAQLLGTAAFGAITLMGAPDLNTTLATGTYGAPLGPGTYAVIATIGFGTPKLITISNDWIVASGSTSTLILIQN